MSAGGEAVAVKPCANCGARAELHREHGRDVSHTWIACSACPMRTAKRGWLGSDASIVDALAYAWNERATPPATIPVEALEGLIERWRKEDCRDLPGINNTRIAVDAFADELTQLIKERSNG